MVDATELVKIFAAIVFGVLIIIALFVYGGEGIVGKVKEAILGAKDILPEVSVGLEEQKAEVTIPDEHKTQILTLQKTIEFMLGEGRKDCFAKYSKFTDVGDASTSLTFTLRDGKTLLTVHGGAGGKQVIDELSAEFQGMKPCVIAGEEDEAAHFESYFLEGEEQLIYPYFKEVNSLTVFSNHKISPSGFDKHDLEDNGYLFTPDGEHICFFPTGRDGIAEKEFTQSAFFSKTSIPVRIKEGKLNLCS